MAKFYLLSLATFLLVSCVSYEKRAEEYIKTLPREGVVYIKCTEKEFPYVLSLSGTTLSLFSLKDKAIISSYYGLLDVVPLVSPDKQNLLFIVRNEKGYNAGHYKVGGRRIDTDIIPEYCSSYSKTDKGAILSVMDSWHHISYQGIILESHKGLRAFMIENGIDSEVFQVFDSYGNKAVYYYKYPDKKTHQLAMFDENTQRKRDYPVSLEERLSEDRSSIYLHTSEQNGNIISTIDVSTGDISLLDSGKYVYFWDNYMEVNLADGSNHYYDWNGNPLESVPWKRAKEAIQGLGDFIGNALGKLFE